MIRTIQIKNYALIEDSQINLSSGFNVVTGETGAGKSLFLSAISLILGEKADTKLIKNQDKETSVLIEIDPKGLKELTSFLKDNELDTDVFILKRTFNNSQSRCFINEQPVSVTQVKKLMANLVYICSQNENTQVADKNEQRIIVDEFIKNPQLVELKSDFQYYQSLLTEKKKIESLSNRTDQNYDYVSYQLDEIKKSEISESDLDIESKIKLIKTQAESNEVFKEVSPLISGEISIKSQFRDLDYFLDRLEKMGHKFDRNKLQESKELFADFLKTFSIPDEDSSSDDLEYWASRSEVLAKILKKHGPSVQDVLEKRKVLTDQLDQIKNSSSILEDLDKKIKVQKAKCIKLASSISKIRQKGLGSLESKITAQLQDLNMKGSEFKISLIPDQELSIHGTDNIEFLFKPHQGQNPLPLSRIASGGELSRVILALNSISSNKGCFLFDEIDAGIGGNTGIKVGEKLEEMAQKNQIICISHLHSVALHADRHFKIEKFQSKTKTTTQIEVLDHEARIKEISRMLGSDLSEKTYAHAKELLEKIQTKK